MYGKSSDRPYVITFAYDDLKTKENQKDYTFIFDKIEYTIIYKDIFNLSKKEQKIENISLEEFYNKRDQLYGGFYSLNLNLEAHKIEKIISKITVTHTNKNKETKTKTFTYEFIPKIVRGIYLPV